MGTESMRKAYLESTRRGIFGTTSARTHSVVGREEIDLPGPAHYQLRDRQCLSRYTQQSAYFASGTTRLTGVPEITAVGVVVTLFLYVSWRATALSPMGRANNTGYCHRRRCCFLLLLLSYHRRLRMTIRFGDAVSGSRKS